MIEACRDKTLLRIYLLPSSSKDEVCGIYQDRLKIKLTSPPVEGEANKALIEFLSSLFKIPKRDVEILRGYQSKRKDIVLSLKLSEVRDLLIKLGILSN